MAELIVVTALVQVLFDKLSTIVLEEFRSFRGIHEELQDVSGKLSTIRALLEDAEEKQLKDKAVCIWLARLKDVAYDMDDFVDECVAAELRLKLERGAQWQWKRQVCDFFFSSSCGHMTCLSNYKAVQKFKNIQDRLDKTARERDLLGLQMLGGTKRLEVAERPQTSSLVDGYNVFGRDEDREVLVNLLLSRNESNPFNVSVLPIVGMCGLGKTTLAQLVYNDEKVKEHFQLRIWVCVSENFDERKLTRETLESTGGLSSATTNMNVLQENLFEKLKGKRFLLVLDDVWNENHDKWVRYRSALIAGEKGSKVLVTTQNENVGRIMGGLPPYRLKRLSEKDCWKLFRNCAFVNGDSRGHPELEEIGKEIVKKMKGLPLAAKALGSLLYSKLDVNDWKGILKSEIWELPVEKNNVLPALRLSYNHLPPHLKQCFAFCSVFHKDYLFEKDTLVQMWMALGFIQPEGRKRLEDIGCSYFDDLVSRSFFQSHKGNYVMHDAIHDLAQSISIDDCIRVESIVKHDAYVKNRHLSFSCGNSMFTTFEIFYKFDRLRTLLLLQGYKSKVAKVPAELFPKLKYLRVLDLHRRDIDELPSSIGNLEHLRYLGLSGTLIESLPSSISRLYNLQTLKLKHCQELSMLPRGVTNLINLRHLEASSMLITSVAGIGRLNCLQELEEFVVRKEKGFKITELKDMAQLRGHFCIRNLENVASGKEAMEAKLQEKEHLVAVELVWEDERHLGFQNKCVDDDVLEALRPNLELQELTVKGFTGFRFANWLGCSSLTNLQSIHISGCKNCNLLPPLGQLPCLRYLDIGGVQGLARIGEEFTGKGSVKGFPLLSELVIEDMPDLQEWFAAEDDQLFGRLSDLRVAECPKLKALPCLPPSLTKLTVSATGIEELPPIRISSSPPLLSELHLHDCPDVTSLQHGLLSHQLLHLRKLTITECKDLAALPDECFQHLLSLMSLHIYNCPRLLSSLRDEGSLPSSLEDLRLCSCSSDFIGQLLKGIKKLSNLTYLKIADCDQLRCFPDDEVPITLKFLVISNLANLQLLPARLHGVSALDTLVVSNCPRLASLPEEGLPDMLQELRIAQCPLLNERLEEYGGKDLHKIARIPNVEIDEERIIMNREERI